MAKEERCRTNNPSTCSWWFPTVCLPQHRFIRLSRLPCAHSGQDLDPPSNETVVERPVQLSENSFWPFRLSSCGGPAGIKFGLVCHEFWLTVGAFGCWHCRNALSHTMTQQGGTRSEAHQANMSINIGARRCAQ